MAQDIKKNISDELINEKSFFDLQFRRDVRYKRPNQPTYYRWRAQLIIVSNINNKGIISEIKSILNCGKICSAGDQIRYAVQNIDDLHDIVVPFFKDKKLLKSKTRELDLWAKAVEIIYRHKGKSLATWNKKDFQDLLKIYKLTQKKKNFSKHKWIPAAESIYKTLNS